MDKKVELTEQEAKLVLNALESGLAAIEKLVTFVGTNTINKEYMLNKSNTVQQAAWMVYDKLTTHKGE